MKKLLIIAALALLLAGEAWGADWYVATTGDDGNAGTAIAPFLTVMKAHNAASNGDTIHIGAGTYAMADGAFGATALNITKSVSILPEPGASVEITSTNASYTVTITPSDANIYKLGAIDIIATGKNNGIVLLNGTNAATVYLDGTKVSGFIQYGFISSTEPVFNLTVRDAVMDGSNPAGGVRAISTDNNTAGVFDIDGLDVTLNCGGASAARAIYIQADGGTDTTVSVKNVTGTLTATNANGGVRGIGIFNVPNAVVEHADFSWSASTAAYSCNSVQIGSIGEDSSGGTIRNSICTMDSLVAHVFQIGVPDDGAQDGLNNNGTITGCVAKNLEATRAGTPHGISVGQGTGFTVTNNWVDNFSPGIVASRTDATTKIFGNLVTGSYGDQALYAKGCTETLFANNTVVMDGAAAKGLAYNVQAIGPTESTDVKFSNNIVYATGANSTFCYGLSASTALFRKNLYYATTALPANAFVDNGTNYATYALWQAAGFDFDGVTANPVFVDVSAGNYQLRYGSPAINAGTNDRDGDGAVDTWITTDVRGRSLDRTGYPLPALGAYQPRRRTAVHMFGFPIPVYQP